MKARLARALVAMSVISMVFALEVGAQTISGSTGGSQPIANYQRSMAMNYYIREQGSYQTNVGEVAIMAGATAPGGYIPMDGRQLNIDDHEQLFTKIGTVYGGDGETTFAVPDMRGRVAIGAGQGSGLTDRAIGTELGSASQTLTTANLPPHSHTLPTGGSSSIVGSATPYTNMQPSITLNYLSTMYGVYPARPYMGTPAATTPELAHIQLYAGYDTPPNYFAAAGQKLSISTYTAVFSLLGTTYGGDGRTNFALPDLRGRTPVHTGGPSNYVEGAVLGTESTSLTLAQIPSHVHAIPSGGNTGASGGGSSSVNNVQPTLTLNYMIATTGDIPSPASSPAANDSRNAYLGEIALFAGNFAPVGYAFCDGQLLDISSNVGLFAQLGYTYGGSGTQFALPDLRGRAIMGVSSDFALGATVGSDSYTLTEAQLAEHTHVLPEPTSLGLAAMGLSVVATRRRRTVR